MLQEIKGNVWNFLNTSSAVCILTNNTITHDGKAIMGGGIAKEALNRNPGLDTRHAKDILNNYFCLGNDAITGAEMIRFPTKNMVWEDSTLEVIEQSLIRLTEYVRCNPDKKVYLPRPGCGLGRLSWEKDVKSLCEKYLDNLPNIYIVSF